MTSESLLSVTGANRGLGLEFVNQLSDTSDTLVIALCRGNSDALEQLVRSRSNLKVVSCDTGDDGSVKVRAVTLVDDAVTGSSDTCDRRR